VTGGSEQGENGTREQGWNTPPAPIQAFTRLDLQPMAQGNYPFSEIDEERDMPGSLGAWEPSPRHFDCKPLLLNELRMTPRDCRNR